MRLRLDVISTAFRKGALTAAVGVLTLGTVALAYAPKDALSYVGPDQANAQKQLDDAKARLSKDELGISGAVELDPTPTFYLDTPNSSVTPGFNIVDTSKASAGVSYRHDNVAILSDRAKVLQLEANLAQLRRHDVEDALLAQAGLAGAQFGVGEAQRNLQDAQQALAQTKTQEANGKANAGDVASAQLSVDSANLDLEQANHDLKSAQADAATYGIDAPTTFQTATFVLPKADYTGTYAYRQNQVGIAAAEANGQRNSTYSVLQNVQLTAGYTGNHYAYSGSLVLDHGRPGADIGAELYTPSTDNYYSISISAKIVFSDSTLNSFTQAADNIKTAKQQAQDAKVQFASDSADRLYKATTAEKQLSLALQRYDLNVRRLQQAQDSLTSLKQDLAKAPADQQNAIKGQIDSSNRDIFFLQKDVRNSDRNRYDRWGAYIRAVGAYLDAVGGTWSIQ